MVESSQAPSLPEKALSPTAASSGGAAGIDGPHKSRSSQARSSQARRSTGKINHKFDDFISLQKEAEKVRIKNDIVRQEAQQKHIAEVRAKVQEKEAARQAAAAALRSQSEQRLSQVPGAQPLPALMLRSASTPNPPLMSRKPPPKVNGRPVLLGVRSRSEKELYMSDVQPFSKTLWKTRADFKVRKADEYSANAVAAWGALYRWRGSHLAFEDWRDQVEAPTRTDYRSWDT
eukprot:gnl/TRDRNA2_/TRDRNA2_180370_c0_seq1.p1 gnl/TRDRNA2_/TRDRNA2_180370_c0~~gnl/TRDRNA2_/TRDRNA2_180370_c0_seq1.p1  ORF type:complete len:232 (-),score=41.68 gnl/TRDRNA2_/TRDRNA2_180370_c0_seq1:121-816(-)